MDEDVSEDTIMWLLLPEAGGGVIVAGCERTTVAVTIVFPRASVVAMVELKSGCEELTCSTDVVNMMPVDNAMGPSDLVELGNGNGGSSTGRMKILRRVQWDPLTVLWDGSELRLKHRSSQLAHLTWLSSK